MFIKSYQVNKQWVIFDSEYGEYVLPNDKESFYWHLIEFYKSKNSPEIAQNFFRAYIETNEREWRSVAITLFERYPEYYDDLIELYETYIILK